MAAYTWPQIDASEGEELPGDEGGEEEGGGLEEGLLPEEDPGEEAARLEEQLRSKSSRSFWNPRRSLTR